MSQGRLLILDDDPTVGQIIAMAAQACGFEARLCESAAGFFDAVRDWQPTHLAIDLTMPDVTGVEVLRRLGEMTCRARVIIASGAGPVELDAALAEAKLLGLPTAGVLPKPFKLAAMKGLLAHAESKLG